MSRIPTALRLLSCVDQVRQLPRSSGSDGPSSAGDIYRRFSFKRLNSIGCSDNGFVDHQEPKEEQPMEILMQIFAPMIVFVYHCFDRIVINGYISMLSR